jgi:CHAT domain-containing protein/tetratricopeptide (TPR) repeat protein
MNAYVRPCLRSAVILLVVLFIIPSLSGRAALLHGAQTVPAPDLDRALRANDLRKARLLIPENWAGAEQLFVSYLERAFITPDAKRRQPDARTLAGRLAGVLRVVTEYEFHAAVLSRLDTADPSQRKELVDVVRDHLAALEHLRSHWARMGDRADIRFNGDSALVRAKLEEAADRYRRLSFAKGEWHAVQQNRFVPPQQRPMIDRFADELGDELYLVRKTAPYSEASLAMAERLDAPKLQATILLDLARRAEAAFAKDGSREQLDIAVRHRERAQRLARTVPPAEIERDWTVRQPSPLYLFGFSALWSDYVQLQRPEQAQAVFSEAFEAARRLGEASVMYTLSVFASAARRLDTDAAADAVLAASRPFGAKAELVATRLLSGSASGSPSSIKWDLAEKAVAMAVALPDPHERAATLEWFSRGALFVARGSSLSPPGDISRFSSAPYRQLRELCLASDESELTSDALVNEADAYGYGKPGNQALASATYLESMQLAERAGNWLKVAQIGNRAAALRPAGGTLADALDFARRAAEAARKADDPLELSMALNRTARTVEEWELAVAAASRNTTQSGNPFEELRALAGLSVAHFHRGEYQAAIDTGLRRAERARVGTGRRPGNADELAAYQILVDMYSQIGEPFLARTTADRVRQLVEAAAAEAAGSSRPNTAAEIWRAYRRLGDIAAVLGEPWAALGYWDTALKRMETPPPTPADLSAQFDRRHVLEARAPLYARLGDFEASLKDWEDVRTMLERTVRYVTAPEALQKAMWSADVAWTHALAGDLDKALSHARDAIAELERDPSGQMSLYRWSFGLEQSAEDRVVEILLRTNHQDEAIAFVERLNRSAAYRKDLTPIGERHLLELLSKAYRKAGQIEKARSLLTAATVVDPGSPTPFSWGSSGAAQFALGRLELEAGNIPQARQHLLAARAAVNPYDANQVWQVERALGMASVRGGDAVTAETHFEGALTGLESVRERLRPEEFRLRFGFDRSQVYDDYAGLLAAKAAASGSQTDAARAFEAAERKRTQTLSALLATGWSRLPSEAVPDQVRRSRDMEARLADKQRILRGQFDQAPDQRDAVLVQKLEADVKQIQADHSRLLASLAQGRYRYAAPTNVAASLASPVQAALGPSRVLVEYLVMEDKSYAFVVSAPGVTVVPLAASRARLRDLAQQLLEPLRQLREGDVDLTRLAYDTRAAYALYQAVFAPVQAALGPATEILVVPDDVLHVVPFEALVERQPRGVLRGGALDAGFAAEAFLIRRYAVSYLTTSAELLPSEAAPAPTAAPRRLFVLANPTARATPAAAQALDDPLKRQLRSAEFAGFLAPLPSAEAEAQRIARVFAPDASTIVTRDKATETAYTSQAGQYDIVHFATHGLAADGQPLYSMLVLGADAAAGSDGFLQAYEVLRTPLRASLVVLGGCETALSGGADWGQGLVGLVAAFRQAGAQSVLATLWTIDATTEEIMSAFYEGVAKGQSPSAALREAKLRLLQQRMRMGKVEISLAHPLFWAPFKLVGAAPNRPATSSGPAR